VITHHPSDVGVENVSDVGRHVNDWEHIAVWVQNDERKFMSASQHGEYEAKAADDVLWEDTRDPNTPVPSPTPTEPIKVMVVGTRCVPAAAVAGHQVMPSPGS
jgi:hypothetical protein